MEKSKICKIRDIYRAIAQLEATFQETYNLNLNEAMLLCTIHENDGILPTAIAEKLGLTASNCSKVIASAEKKKLIRRKTDKVDKRQMHFTLTPAGEELIVTMQCFDLPLPNILNKVL